MDKPHSAAAELDQFIKDGIYLSEEERRYHALLTSAEVFNARGFRWRGYRGEPGAEEWESIRRHWRLNGNLIKDKDIEGYLLPMEVMSYQWAWKYDPAPHTPESYFKDFVRWRPSDHPNHPNYNIKVSVIKDSRTLSRWEDRGLRIAVVPLVASVDDFNLDISGDDIALPVFSMSLKDPKAILRAALNAIEASAAEGCDIVIFPELCLTPDIQESLRKEIHALPGEYPWLVVAGSARTPVAAGPEGAYYNQSLVYDNDGLRILTHHKRYHYSMSVTEQERYGLLEAFGHVDRREDMYVEPFELEILDTDIGRLAILICEDLSVEDFVKPLVVKFGLNWLFVPVLDGCQMPDRWTARLGLNYARFGAGVVVATSLSLAQQHLHSLPDPTGHPGVGTIVVPFEYSVRILKSSAHDLPVFIDLGAPSTPFTT